MTNSLQAALDVSTAEDLSKPKTKPQKKLTKPKKAATRQHTVLIGGHFSPDVKKQLRMIAAEEDTTSQALLTEALNLLFRKKGKQAIL